MRLTTVMGLVGLSHTLTGAMLDGKHSVDIKRNDGPQWRFENRHVESLRRV
jgi:hypothetical protein